MEQLGSFEKLDYGVSARAAILGGDGMPLLFE